MLNHYPAKAVCAVDWEGEGRRCPAVVRCVFRELTLLALNLQIPSEKEKPPCTPFLGIRLSLHLHVPDQYWKVWAMVADSCRDWIWLWSFLLFVDLNIKGDTRKNENQWNKHVAQDIRRTTKFSLKKQKEWIHRDKSRNEWVGKQKNRVRNKTQNLFFQNIWTSGNLPKKTAQIHKRRNYKGKINWGNWNNHDMLLCSTLWKQIWKPGWNGQFLKKISLPKLTSEELGLHR